MSLLKAVSSSGSGGGGTPGGTSGQVQYNNAGAFGGFTVSGDGTLNTSTGVLTVNTIGGAAPWLLGGNALAALQNIGATTNFGVAFITNNLERMRLLAGGGLAIAATTIGTVNKLTVNANSTVDNLATVQLNASNASNKVLVVQGIASQSANLFEAQKSDATVLAYINNTGGAVFSDAVTLAGGVGHGLFLSRTLVPSQYVSIGRNINTIDIADSVAGVYWNSLVGASFQPNLASSVGIISKQFTSQTADLFQLQDVNANVLSGYNNNGRPYSYGTGAQILGLSIPVISSVTPTGTTGATTYGYRVAAINAAGTTLASTEVTTTTGNATLSGSNYNAVTWGAILGATQYKVYGRTAGSELLMKTINAPTVTYNDTGVDTPSGALPTALVGTKLTVQGWNAQSGNFFEVNNSAGSNLLAVNASGETAVNTLRCAGNFNIFAGGYIQLCPNSINGGIFISQNGSLGFIFNTQASGAFAMKFVNSGATTDLIQMISPGTASVPLAIIGATSQSGNLQEWRNSSGTPLLAVSSGGLINIYNNIATVANGVPSIYGQGRSTAQTAAVASVATYTVGASDGSFIVSANANVTAFTAGTFNVNVAYTDETNTAQTLKLSFSSLTGTIGIAIAATGPFEGIPAHIRCKASTSITISTSGTFTSLTYNVEGYISQIG